MITYVLLYLTENESLCRNNLLLDYTCVRLILIHLARSKNVHGNLFSLKYSITDSVMYSMSS